MDASGWSAWTGNAIAIVSIGYTWWASRGSKSAAAAARQQAADSLKTARGAEAAQVRMADAMEKLLEEQDRHRATGAAGQTLTVPTGVTWHVEHVQGELYDLTNAGPSTAYDVRVSASDALHFEPPDRHDGQQWAPDDTGRFFAVGSWETGTPTLTVRWRESPDGQVHTWERIVPR